MHNDSPTYSGKFYAALDIINDKIKLGTLHNDEIERALVLSHNSEHLLALAINNFKSGNLKTAEQISLAILRHYPNCYDTLNTLGIILKNQNRFEQAIAVLRKATLINPTSEYAWLNLGNNLIQIEKYEESLNCFIKALEHHPNHLEAIRLKGVSYMRLENYPQAIDTLSYALTIEPNNLTIILDLCASFHNCTQYEKVLDYIEPLLKQSPDNIELLTRKALAFKCMGEISEGIAIFEKILQHKPDDAETNFRLGCLYLNANKGYSHYKACYIQAYNAQPNTSKYLLALCSILSFNQAEAGDLDHAHQLADQLIDSSLPIHNIAEVIQRIALRTMDYPLYAKIGSFKDINLHFAKNNINTSLLYQMGQVISINDRHDLLQANRIWGTQLEKTVNSTLVKRKVKQRLNNKVRLGVLSSDLKNNNIGRFIWPLIKYLDKNKFELYCYAMDTRNYDYIEETLINNSDSFKVCEGNDNTVTAQSLADDNLDILIEISAWHRNSLAKMVAHHPADMQISWLDYPGSIGLPTTIDYIVTDPYIKPKDPTLLIEKQLVMPHTWFSTAEELFVRMDIATTLPEDRKSYITFGTMNSVHKLNVINLKTWAEIMHKFPNSKFLYVRPETSSSILQQNFYKYMKEFGIDNNRISFVSTKTDHLKYYNEIDIAFDTFPHTGGTTTCEALWMGVPVVSLIGAAFFERISYSNLSNCGLADLCASDVEQYKNIAISLVNNKDRRYHLRQNLRHQIIKNPLGKTEAFAKDFGKCLLNVWGK